MKRYCRHFTLHAFSVEMSSLRRTSCRAHCGRMSGISTLVLACNLAVLMCHRSFMLQCYCSDSDGRYEIDYSMEVDKILPAEPRDVLCPAFDHPLLQDALSNMPRLTTLRLAPAFAHNYGHGLSWRTMKTLLSLPHLQAVTLHSFHVTPQLIDGERPQFNHLSPFTTFNYYQSFYRRLRKLPSEQEGLQSLMHAAHTASLEVLRLPAETAPVEAISMLPWPRLRELQLYGARWTSPATPIISLFANLTGIQVLDLALSDPEGGSVETRAVWPRGHEAYYPWPELRRLYLSHPSTHDEVYSHLPPSLETLALRQWPRCYRRPWSEIVVPSHWIGRAFPLTQASTLLKVLTGSKTSSYLRELDLEYRADPAESDLFHEISVKFPCLHVLELHRYRESGSDDIPVVSRHSISVYYIESQHTMHRCLSPSPYTD